MLKTLIKHETYQTILGPAGNLELAVYQQQNRPNAAWGIVCHPHPQHGGAMYNKVVTTLVKTFQDVGLNTVRFNFRGVGNSQGSFAQGEGELDDLVAVLNWIQESQRNYDFWLAGFSFGAYIAARAATKIPFTRLILVAPPVEHFAMETLPPFSCPTIIVQGEKDDVVLSESVLKWAEERVPKPTILRFPNAGHFFHGELQSLRTRLIDAIKANPFP